MNRSTYVTLGVAAFALALLTFVVRGSTRLIVGEQIAIALSAPVALVALCLVLVVFVLTVLHVTGLRPIEPDDPR